jgi:hypothetical protein
MRDYLKDIAKVELECPLVPVVSGSLAVDSSRIPYATYSDFYRLAQDLLP